MEEIVERLWRKIAAAGWMIDVLLVTATPEENPEHSGMFCVRIGQNQGYGWTAPRNGQSIYRPTLVDAMTEADGFVEVWLRPWAFDTDRPTDARDVDIFTADEDQIWLGRMSYREVAQRVVDDHNASLEGGDHREQADTMAARGLLSPEQASEGITAERVQVGWVRFDGDEFHDFRYFSPDDRHRSVIIAALNGLPVYVDRTEGM